VRAWCWGHDTSQDREHTVWSVEDQVSTQITTINSSIIITASTTVRFLSTYRTNYTGTCKTATSLHVRQDKQRHYKKWFVAWKCLSSVTPSMSGRRRKSGNVLDWLPNVPLCSCRRRLTENELQECMVTGTRRPMSMPSAEIVLIFINFNFQ